MPGFSGLASADFEGVFAHSYKPMENFVTISGCSGGGKSTLLSELRRRGFATIDEPGSWHRYGFVACPASKRRHTCSDARCRMGAECAREAGWGVSGCTPPLSPPVSAFDPTKPSSPNRCYCDTVSCVAESWMDLKLVGKRALVTGASAGIGAAVYVRVITPHSPDNALSFGAACAIQI
jgi:hypothetical protein